MGVAYDRMGLKGFVAQGQVRIQNGTMSITMAEVEWKALVTAIEAALALKELERYEGAVE